MAKSKTRSKYIYFLAITSMLSFLTTAVLSFFNIDIWGYATSFIFIIMGFGLMVEGQIRNIIKMSKNGLTPNEVSHITASIVGLVALISGIIALIGLMFGIDQILSNNTFSVIKGVLSLICITVIAIETWVAD